MFVFSFFFLLHIGTEPESYLIMIYRYIDTIYISFINTYIMLYMFKLKSKLQVTKVQL